MCGSALPSKYLRDIWFIFSGVARVIVFFGGQVASGEGILGDPLPNFYTDLDFWNGLEHNWGGVTPLAPPLTTPLFIFRTTHRALNGSSKYSICLKNTFSSMLLMIVVSILSASRIPPRWKITPRLQYVRRVHSNITASKRKILHWSVEMLGCGCSSTQVCS